jgi:hypothetical protein
VRFSRAPRVSITRVRPRREERTVTGRWNGNEAERQMRSRRDTLSELGEFMCWLVRPSGTAPSREQGRPVSRWLKRFRSRGIAS